MLPKRPSRDLRWVGGFGRSAEIAEATPCHEALEAADDLPLALSFGGTALDLDPVMGLGRQVAAGASFSR
jgi:hypothetical protein